MKKVIPNAKNYKKLKVCKNKLIELILLAIIAKYGSQLVNGLCFKHC